KHNGDAVTSPESPIKDSPIKESSTQENSSSRSIKRKSRPRTAVDARSRAQQLAFAPIIFYATVVMRDSGLLAQLARSQNGLSLAELGAQSGLSDYAVSVLVDLARDADIVKDRGGRF